MTINQGQLAGSPHTRFTPPCGPIDGWFDGAVVRVTGIPYARAARFQAPVSLEPWLEPLQAVERAPACPQTPVPEVEAVIGHPTGGLLQSEDCQNLSITAPPDLVDGEALPVLVWIHGGSYVSGAGDASIYDPQALVLEQRVIVVAVTYRLGMLGFWGGQGRPANLGLLDQIAALEWVQQNIGAFGGNPDNVTAFGQSAGADAIAHIMATPNSCRLMARAIIQSAPFGISRGRHKMYDAMAIAATIDAASPIEDVLRAQELVTAAATPFGLRGAMAFGTQYGQYPLPPESGVEAAWNSAARNIPILIGHTAEESRLFIPMTPPLKKLSESPFGGRVLATAISSLLTRIIYTRGARRFARRHRRAGGRATFYRISFRAPGNPYRSAHAIDIPLLLGNDAAWADVEVLRGITSQEHQTSAQQTRTLWARFARGENLPGQGCIPNVLTYSDVPH